MAEDYYKTLDVPRNASQADIQKAYRELARKYHPDMNPDDKSATKKFQKIQAAFDVLNNPEKREMYDRYGSSFETRAGGSPWGAGPGAGYGGGRAGATVEDMDFSQFFGDRFGDQGEGGLGDIFAHFRRAAAGGGAGGGGRARAATRRRGADMVHELEIPFNTSVIGGEVQIAVQRPSGKTETITVKIPPGIEDGKKIRIRGQGEAAPGGKGTPGDILLTILVAPHPSFQRRGNHLQVRLPVTLAEAALGAKVDVPTPGGTVAVTVPPGTSSGTKLRIKGRGVASKNQAAGDLFAEVQIVLPKKLNDADRETIRQFDEHYPLKPRENLHW